MNNVPGHQCEIDLKLINLKVKRSKNKSGKMENTPGHQCG